MDNETLREPWLSFFREIDGRLEFEIGLELLGGFIVTVVYGSPRTTSDIDVVSILSKTNSTEILNLAGEGSVLHKKHKIYLDWVGVAQLPENYDERVVEIFPKYFKHLRLLALDPYDIALSKIERNIQRDRDDVKYLAKVVPFDLNLLRKRYYDEFRIYLGNPKREDLTMQLWIEMINEDRNRPS